MENAGNDLLRILSERARLGAKHLIRSSNFSLCSRLRCICFFSAIQFFSDFRLPRQSIVTVLLTAVVHISCVIWLTEVCSVRVLSAFCKNVGLIINLNWITGHTVVGDW